MSFNWCEASSDRKVSTIPATNANSNTLLYVYAVSETRFNDCEVYLLHLDVRMREFSFRSCLKSSLRNLILIVSYSRPCDICLGCVKLSCILEMPSPCAVPSISQDLISSILASKFWASWSLSADGIISMLRDSVVNSRNLLISAICVSF